MGFKGLGGLGFKGLGGLGFKGLRGLEGLGVFRGLGCSVRVYRVGYSGREVLVTDLEPSA